MAQQITVCAGKFAVGCTENGKYFMAVHKSNVRGARRWNVVFCVPHAIVKNTSKFMQEYALVRIVFMGSADFGLPALDALIGAGHQIVGIVSTPPRPRGRGLALHDSPVTVAARERALGPILLPESLKDPALVEELSALQADLFVVVAFRILPPPVFSIPRLGTVNIHASLLPRFRGPAPIHRAIEAGESETGVTIFRIDEGIDTGGVLLQRTTAIGQKETTPQVYDRLSTLGAEALVEAVAMLQKGEVRYVPQDHAQASKAPKLKKEEARIDWRQDAEQLYNRLRAFKPFPGFYTMLEGKRLGIEWAEAIASDGEGEAGTIGAVGDSFFEVTCGRGCLRVFEVKPEGKKLMPAGAFMRGRRVTKGIVLQ